MRPIAGPIALRMAGAPSKIAMLPLVMVLAMPASTTDMAPMRRNEAARRKPKKLTRLGKKL